MKKIVPAGVLAQHVIALGKTGAGKSSCMRVLVEGLLEEGKPLTIIDPKGDWFGIKSSADGKRPGYPVVIFGGEHADVPLNPRAGAAVAELIATGNRPSLIDLGGWMVGERTRFFIDFASTLFKFTKGMRHLVIDEVHNFAPQGKILDVDAGKMLHWANRLASEGRGKGITIIAASQRPQKVHKDFLTSCETLIAMRVIHKLDRDAIKDWIDGCADPAKGREVLATLAGMKRGEAWVWSPEIDFGPERLTFPMFVTYDSFKPQIGDTTKLKGWAEVDLDDVRTKLAAVVEEAQANDPVRLRARIAELERAAKKVPAVPSARPINTRVMALDAYAHGLADTRAKCKKIAATGEGIVIAAVRKAFDAIQAEVSSVHPTPPQEIGRIATPAEPEPRHEAPRRSGNGSSASLPKGEAAVLAACIQFPNGLRREQLTVLTGYRRSTRDAYIQRLRERGFVLGSELIVATIEGRAALPNAEPLPIGKNLRDYWFKNLPEGERVILSALCSKYPKAVARNELESETGYQRSTRDAYLQRLAAKQLVTEPARGEVRATDDLFD